MTMREESESDPAGARADELARESATDPRHSILLQAPAGSGKTTVLTQRILRLLAQADEPEEILAITFTRKAAAEMRKRVLKALQGEIEEGAPQAALLRKLASSALQRAAARGWDLARDPGRLRIQTIDSFNFRLASQLPVSAQAGGGLVIADQPRELYARAARRTLTSAEQDEQAAADAELLFERLDNHWHNVEKLLADMLERRAHWLRYVLDHEPSVLCERIGDSLGSVVGGRLVAADRLMGSALRGLGVLPDVGRLGSEVASLAGWKKLASLCLTLKGEWRKPTGISKTLGSVFEQPAARETLKTAIETLRGIAGAREALCELQSLPGAALGVSDTAAVEALSRLLKSAATHLQAEFAVDGRVDHTYVAGAARQALAEGGLPTDLALRTGLSLRHILVDEFQDTSLAQFDLIEGLTSGWAEGDGRTLFVVGDPMQSIYQFREAEVGLFLRARDRGIGNVRLRALRLTRNFRATHELIAWTNQIFGGLFPASDDLRASAVAFTPSLGGQRAAASVSMPARNSNSQPSVRLRLFASDDRAAEATAIAEEICTLKREQPEATVAVLVASRAHAASIMGALEIRAMPVIGVDLIPLGELSIVRDLVALTRALHHLGDRTAWLAVLRAPWCGVSLATLTVLSPRGDKRLIVEAIADKSRLAKCSPADRARLERVHGVLEDAIARRGDAPFADWLERTWLRLGAADAYPALELRHARAFLSALGDQSAAGEWQGPEGLDSLIADLYAQPRASVPNPVQVMTIHRAKGLEFDHVFVPSLDRDLGHEREPLLRWLDLPRADGGTDLIMSPVPAIGEDEGGDVGAFLKRLIARRTANEQARLLYVAATRSRQTLYWSAAPKLKSDGVVQPRSGTLLAIVWPVLGPQFVAVNSIAPSQVQTNPEALQPLRRLREGWHAPELDTLPALERLPLAHRSLEHLEFSWVQETARSVGTVVHAALEEFAQTPELPSSPAIEGQKDAFAHQLRRHGVPEREIPRAVGLVLEALTRTVEDKHGRWILSREHHEAGSELALTGIANGRLTNVVIDRSFVDRGGTRWVIDFKTSRHEGGGLETFLEQEMERYRPQLETYVSLARSLGPQPVRAGLYFPLLGVFREMAAA